MRRVGGTVRKPWAINNGYLVVDLWRNNKRFRRTVHSLVAEAFIGPRPAGHDVNHGDLNKTNNRRDNLEWTTKSGNQKHAYLAGRNGLRTKNWRTSLSAADLVEIRMSPATQQELAKRFHIGQATVNRIRHKVGQKYGD